MPKESPLLIIKQCTGKHFRTQEAKGKTKGQGQKNKTIALQELFSPLTEEKRS